MVRTAFLLALVCACLHTMPAFAQTAIGVVDVQALLTQSEAALSIEKQVDAYKEQFMKDIAQREQSLREAEKSLVDQRSALNKDEYAAKAREFEKGLIETRKLAELKRRRFDKASAKALGTLRDHLYGIVQELAKERGYSLVISKQNVIVGEQSIDLTDEAMRRLNKKISSIELKIFYN